MEENKIICFLYKTSMHMDKKTKIYTYFRIKIEILKQVENFHNNIFPKQFQHKTFSHLKKIGRRKKGRQ